MSFTLTRYSGTRRKYYASDLAGVPCNPRSPLNILANVFFIAKHGTPCAMEMSRHLCYAAGARPMEEGAR